MADPIKAAKQKAAKRWAKLDSETVPLYGKISNGKATEADFKKLAKLYEEQSKLASDTFQQSLDAAKASAKDQVRNTVKKSVKANQLLSTPELQKLLETTITIVLQKSADLIRTAVSEALEENIEQVTRLIKDVRRMQVKNDEVLYRLRRNAITFATPNFFQQLLHGNEQRKPIMQRLRDLMPEVHMPRLFKKKKDEFSENIEKLADLIAAKVTIALTAFDDFKNKSKGFFSRFFSRENKELMKSRAEQAKLIAEEFLKRILEFLSDKKRQVSNYLFGPDSFIRKSFDKLFRREEDIDSRYTIHTTEQMNSLDKVVEAVEDYRKLDEDYRDEELEKARDQESTYFERAIEHAVNLSEKLYPWLKKTAIGISKEIPGEFSDKVEELTGTIDTKLQEASESIEEDFNKALEKNSMDSDAIKKFGQVLKESRKYDKFSDKAYKRYRAIVLREVKRQWTNSAKEKLDYMRRRLRRYGNRAFNFLKWFGIAYIASLIIKGLTYVMPSWREDLNAWMSNEGMQYLKEGGEATGHFIGNAITATLQFIGSNYKQIFGFMYDVAKGMLSTIFESALIAMGIDPDDILGHKKTAALERNYQATQENTDLLNRLSESTSIPGLVDSKTGEAQHWQAGQIYQSLSQIASDDSVDLATAPTNPQDVAKYVAEYPSVGRQAYEQLLNAGLSKQQITEGVTSVRSFLKDSGKKNAAQLDKDYAKITGKAPPGSELANKALEEAAKAKVPEKPFDPSKAFSMYESPYSVTDDLNVASPFYTNPNNGSEVLRAQPDATVSSSQNPSISKDVNKTANENTIIEQTKPVKPKSSSAAPIGTTVANQVNSDTNSIPTYMGTDLVVQNLGLTYA